MSSIPTDKRIISSEIPALCNSSLSSCAWVVLAGCITRDFASPTFAMVAPTNLVPTPSAITQMPSFTGPYNLTGLPAISVPAGFTDEGLPVGLQLAANAFKEHELLQLAYIYERETCFYKTRPNL